MIKLFACAFSCNNHRGAGKIASLYVLADTRESAMGIAYAHAISLFPESEGYYGHISRASEVPSDTLRYVLGQEEVAHDG